MNILHYPILSFSDKLNAYLAPNLKYIRQNVILIQMLSFNVEMKNGKIKEKHKANLHKSRLLQMINISI